ncbi:MAG TPA: type I-E CRISPR-associated protein Cse1/CasA [Candidatus Corynebacterium gallistercoris]|uniref:Type I-E CRISPR-associated protein Cse1/CasA n=1 Tax=Candidatus Corynebacterium gallistercoris TaxID=2838530 RepID=A0A9D1RZ28_9CORY|nr:type I-E CRISPR-associated protein Cse1/CasA [Candidatus Corynebacterium gallistercoris]
MIDTADEAAVDEVTSFNLLDEPWVLCQTTNGAATLSIREIFDGSATVLKIVGDSPTQDYAVLRVLLAIYWRAHHHALAPQLKTKGDREAFSWSEWFEERLEEARESSRDDVVLRYLDTVEDRFDLLHPTQPFMQVADLHTESGKASEISRIIPEAEHDYFTMRTAAGRKELSFPEAARWLIHVHAYDYSGIKSGAVGDPRVKGGRGYPIGTGWTGMTGGTVIRGSNLLETMVLNSTPSAIFPEDFEDLPVWERKADTAQQRTVKDPQPTGAADLATWQSRRVRLFTQGDKVTAVLVSNGDRIPDAGKNVTVDPMTPYRFSPNQSKKGLLAYYAKPYETNRTMWKALDALIVTEGDAGFTDKNRAPIRPETLSFWAELAEDGIVEGVLDLSLVSMGYGAQSSSVATTTSTDIGIPLQALRSNELSDALRQDIRNAATDVSKAATALGAFSGQLLVASGGAYEFGADTADRLYALLEPLFIVWIRSVGRVEPDEHAAKWQREVKKNVFLIADELVRGAGPRALIGRTEGGEDGNSSGRIVSAATVYSALRRKIAEALPLAEETHTESRSSS